MNHVLWAMYHLLKILAFHVIRLTPSSIAERDIRQALQNLDDAMNEPEDPSS